MRNYFAKRFFSLALFVLTIFGCAAIASSQTNIIYGDITVSGEGQAIVYQSHADDIVLDNVSVTQEVKVDKMPAEGPTAWIGALAALVMAAIGVVGYRNQRKKGK